MNRRNGAKLWLHILSAALIVIFSVIVSSELESAKTKNLRKLAPKDMAWRAIEQPNLREQIIKAKALTVETVCTPVKSVRRGRLLWVPNPNATTYDLIQIYFKEYGGPNEIVIIDLSDGSIKQIKQPRYMQWHLCSEVVAPNGKLYISVLGQPNLRQEICIYDPATNELKIRALPIPPTLRGESHPLTLGTNGKLYMIGAHPTKAASACQIDPETAKITDYGPIGPSHAPSRCWGYSGAADDRFIYIASGKVPWYLVAFDHHTRKSKVLIKTEKVGGYIGIKQHRYGCSAWAKNVIGTNGERIEYWLYRGRAIPKKLKQEPPPWPSPENKKPWVVMPRKPQVYMENATPSSNGRCEIWLRSPRDSAALLNDISAENTQENLGWKHFRYKIETFPMATYRVVELPDGRIFGTAGAYEGNFMFDPKSGKCCHLGKIRLSHYTTAIHNGNVYMSGYPNSPLYIYDLSKPWNMIIGGCKPDFISRRETHQQSNPRLVERLNKFAGTHKMYATAIGSDGKIYFGGRWYRNGSGGGLAWWDPNEQKAGGLWETFSNYQVTHMTTASSGRYIIISTCCVRDEILGKPKPRQGRLFFFDTTQGKIVKFVDPVQNAKGSGLVAGVGGSRVLGLTQDPNNLNCSILYGVDVEEGAVMFRKIIPYGLNVQIGSNQKGPFDYRLGPDGKVWTYIGPALVRINPGNARIEVIGKIKKGGRIAFSGHDIYLSGMPELRRINNVVPK